MLVFMFLSLLGCVVVFFELCVVLFSAVWTFLATGGPFGELFCLEECGWV